MSQNEQGNVYAFRLSGSKMRQSAVQLRRQGQVVDALALVRRAAEQDDTPAAWYALAGELRQTGNWETAVQVLSRVVSQEPHHPGAWAGLARCLHMLGQTALAVDCAYHQLQEDPWSAEADAARGILAELDVGLEGKEPRRTQRLIHRGLTAWQSGDRAMGERRIRRALRLVEDKARLYVTAAMMCMLAMDLKGALHYLPRALREDPADPRTLTALSTLYHQLGKRRLALGLLIKAGKHADQVMAEDGFLTTAWAQDAWPEMDEYLTRRMKAFPHRTALLSAKATMHCEHGDMPQARQLWKEILAIDPDDRQASTLIAAAQERPGGFIHAPGMLPRPERQKQMNELRMACENLTTQELLRPGIRARRLVDWFIVSNDAQERQLVMQVLEAGDSNALIPYLKELLCRPFLRMEMRQWALIQLAQRGCQDEMLMMAGEHYTLVACQKVDESKARQPWRIFLPVLLKETRRTCPAEEMAEFAASLWRMMSDEQRMHAAGAGRLVWCRAMEILFLRMAGEEERAVRVAVQTPVSARRISRVLRQLGRKLAVEIVME